MYIPCAHVGGPSRYVDSILAALDPAEFAVVLFGHAAGPYADRPNFVAVEGANAPAAAAGAPIGRERPASAVRQAWNQLGPAGLKLWAGFGRKAVQLARCFRRCHVELLHTNNTGCEESAVAARLAGVGRVLGTLHVDPTCDLHGTRASGRYRVLEYLSNHCLGRAIAVSASAGEHWARRTRLPARRIVTIRNGIDPARFSRRLPPEEARRRLGLPAAGAPVIGSVGRLDPVKGYSDLLRAVAGLAEPLPDLQLVLAGAGPARASLEAEARQLGIAARVHFPGFCADVQPILDALDVFVLPSLAETLGYALLEAMATGLPTVGTAVGGIPEVIVPHVTGSLVPPRDAAALAAALLPLLRSAELRARLGAAGRERVVQHFNEAGAARRTIALYRQMLRTAG